MENPELNNIKNQIENFMINVSKGINYVYNFMYSR